MKAMFAILWATVLLQPAYASDTPRQSYSLAGAVITPDGTMVPKFTVIVKRRTDKPQLVRRLHFTEGLFELQNLERGQYSIEITSSTYSGVFIKTQLGESKSRQYRIVVMHPVRNEEEALTKSFTFSTRRNEPQIPPQAEQAYTQAVELHRQGKLDE